MITYARPEDDPNRRQSRDIVATSGRVLTAGVVLLSSEPYLVQGVRLEQARRAAAEIGPVALGALERAWRVEGITAQATVTWLKAKRVDLGDGRDLAAVAFRARNEGAAHAIEWFGMGWGAEDGLLVECSYRATWKVP